MSVCAAFSVNGKTHILSPDPDTNTWQATKTLQLFLTVLSVRTGSLTQPNTRRSDIDRYNNQHESCPYCFCLNTSSFHGILPEIIKNKISFFLDAYTNKWQVSQMNSKLLFTFFLAKSTYPVLNGINLLICLFLPPIAVTRLLSNNPPWVFLMPNGGLTLRVVLGFLAG